MINWIIPLTSLVTAAILAVPRLSRAETWRAMTTPLASIIGSGFLVLGPVLNAIYGAWAPAIMVLLCLVAYLIGAAVRYNIADRQDGRGRAEIAVDHLSSWALAFAYFIAVAYYLNLFGAFAVDLTPWNDEFHARLVTSAIFIVILVVGLTRGFSALERMEQVSVGIKLSIIAGMLVGLGIYFGEQSVAGALVLNPVTVGPWQAITLGFGLIVTVQGFETSRYLGRSYSPEVRIRSMRWAQITSSAIYLVYIGLASYVFGHQDIDLDEAAIISMMAVVAPVLPIMLVGAALSAQFSAAIADTSGAGGLVAELTGDRLKPAHAYALLVATGLALTWSFDVFEIISHASRAFALYYAFQAAVAAISASRAGERWHQLGFGLLSAFALAMAVLGTPVE